MMSLINYTPSFKGKSQQSLSDMRLKDSNFDVMTFQKETKVVFERKWKLSNDFDFRWNNK